MRNFSIDLSKDISDEALADIAIGLLRASYSCVYDLSKRKEDSVRLPLMRNLIGRSINNLKQEFDISQDEEEKCLKEVRNLLKE